MSDSAKLRFTYGIIQLVLGIIFFIFGAVFATIGILNTVDELTSIGFPFLIFGVFPIWNSVDNFIECGKFQEKDKR